MKLRTIDHLVITTGDLDACLNFYEGILGMRTAEQNGRYALLFGLHKINIHTRPAEFLPAAERPVPGSLDLCLEVEEEIERVLLELRGKQAPLVTGIVERRGARGPMRSIYLRDPDGNLVELCSYTSSTTEKGSVKQRLCKVTALKQRAGTPHEK